MKTSISNRTVRCALLAVIASLVLAPAALAAGSSTGGYAGEGGQIQSQVTGGDPGGPQGPSASASSASTPGGLPFTGLDIGILAIGGLLLVGAGAALTVLTPSRKAHHTG
jgi:hypothetical protein